jgi:hypothetical protein
MPYVYSDVDSLQDTPKVGTKQCVALVQNYAAGLPHTPSWKEGDVVIQNTQIAKGTVIATFVDGKYQSLAHGNHAAFYLSQDAGGIWVMDQWADDRKKPLVSKRYLRRQGKLKNGQYVNPVDNADAYSIVE